ncbi:hypothetical protein [Pseudemcibacter aquimaris]|uniref:hypothetical protein n=1 Tax=Pseudemcibacter aquimaris TaxID=2857064 RepID=UPI0020122692|nr:hypothetical protein [Pseudemcibacter aquimaris]MCC3859773.1 hypothetical protein [Pseudemcibacter aquimaris]WDU60167.1 hypothetical protein KW060_07840 [Pseudemcibacter aquimaris]
MGGSSKSSNSTSNKAYDNRVLHNDQNDNSVSNEYDYEDNSDHSVTNEYDFEDRSDHSYEDNSDHSYEDRSDHSISYDLGNGAISTTGDVSITSMDAEIAEDAFNFAENIANESLTTSSQALSQAFSSTAGGVIEAGRDFVKSGAVVLAAIALLMFLNKDK